MNAPADPRADWLAALAWQVELGADEAIGDAPVDRFAESAPGAGGASQAGENAPGRQASVSAAGAPAPSVPVEQEGARGDDPRRSTRQGSPTAGRSEPSGSAAARSTNSSSSSQNGRAEAAGDDVRALAESAQTLEELAEAIRAWTGSPLRDAARNLVFSDGMSGARLMVIGEAPGAEEDRVGKPFVGRAGQLLDRMLAAIGLGRTAPAPEDAVYITNILPWRPPGNRTPTEAEAQQFLPFVERHIALAAPDVILAVGNTPTKALLGTVTGIKRMRGTWARHAASGLPLMPCFHPAYLLRTPGDKRLAWRDLLAVRRALDGEGTP